MAYATIRDLSTKGLAFNDPRSEPCAYQYCDQIATCECQAQNGAAVRLCEEHTGEFAKAWQA